MARAPAWTLRQNIEIFRSVRPFARTHRACLWAGLAGSVAVVVFRLALPWPLRGIVEAVFPSMADGGNALASLLPVTGDPVVIFCVLYFLLALGVGVAEMIQRVQVKKFTARTVDDLRAAAVEETLQQDRARAASDSADLLARIVGDSARVREGMSGILVHLFLNGLLFLAVCALLLYISPQLGLIFLIAGLLAILIGLRDSSLVASMAHKHREREGEFATAVQQALDDEAVFDPAAADLLHESSEKDVTTTRLIAWSSLKVHVVLGATVALALWMGAGQVRAGTLAPGELFLFIAYALTVHRRTVQIGRQIARSGKVAASLKRMNIPKKAAAKPAALPLRTGLRLEKIRLTSTRGHRKKPRLRKISLQLTAGSHVAVLGKSGSGKTSLLRLLAGLERPSRGSLFWDALNMNELNGRACPVAYLPQDLVFPSRPLWRHLGLPALPESPDDELLALFKALGMKKIIKRLRRGLGETVSSAHLARGERRAIALCAVLLRDDALWLLDDPFEGLKRKRAARRVETVLARAAERTVVIAMSRPAGIDRFDRVLKLRRGRINFDGSPSEWETHRHARTHSGRGTG